MATCPQCLETIKDGARKCPHCQSELASSDGNAKDTVFIVDRGLVKFGKFALGVAGLLAVILYSALGLRIQEALKDIEGVAKNVSLVQREIEDARIKYREKSLDDQKEIARLKAEFEKEGQSLKASVTATIKEISGLRSEFEGMKADSQHAVAEVKAILADAQSANEAVNKIRQQITLASVTVNVIERDGPSSAPEKPSAQQNQHRGKLWPVGATLKVWFMDGGDGLRRDVLEIANEWSRDGNIRFAPAVSAREADLRVRFSNAGNWSYIGTDNKMVPKDQQTMNLLTIKDVKARRGDILHEFGHALGFLHEHQSPKSNILWNIAAMQASLNFTRSDIEAHFTAKYSPETAPCDRDFDPNSVMMFDIPKEFTTDNQSYAPATQLSNGDRACIRKMYPGR